MDTERLGVVAVDGQQVATAAQRLLIDVTVLLGRRDAALLAPERRIEFTGIGVAVKALALLSVQVVVEVDDAEPLELGLHGLRIGLFIVQGGEGVHGIAPVNGLTWRGR